MLAGVLVVAAAVAAVVVLLYQGAALWLARGMPRLDPLPPPATDEPQPGVGVVVAARDEDQDLPETLASLRAQDLPGLEVVVVESRSPGAAVRPPPASDPLVRRLEEPPLPAGWVGKNWACWVGAHEVRAPWLLFLDADVRLAPTAVRTTVAWAAGEGASLATIAPRVEMASAWERTVLPFYVQMVLTYFRAPHVNRDRSRAAMANGQYWLVRRADYEALGGHEAVRGQLLEDVAIARRFRAAGRRLRLAWAPELAATRMYRDRHEMFEGLLKNVHGTEFSAWRQLAFLAGLVGFFWLPLAVLPIGLLAASLPLVTIGAVLAVALFAKHAAFARAVGAPARYGLLFPVAVGFYVALVLTSLGRGVRGGSVTWKGRSYRLGPRRSP